MSLYGQKVRGHLSRLLILQAYTLLGEGQELERFFALMILIKPTILGKGADYRPAVRTQSLLAKYSGLPL